MKRLMSESIRFLGKFKKNFRYLLLKNSLGISKKCGKPQINFKNYENFLEWNFNKFEIDFSDTIKNF